MYIFIICTDTFTSFTLQQKIRKAHSIPFTTNHYKTPKQSFGLLGMCQTMALQRTHKHDALHQVFGGKGCTFSRTPMGHILMPLLFHRKYYSCPHGLASPFLRLNHCPWHILLQNTCTAYKPLYSTLRCRPLKGPGIKILLSNKLVSMAQKKMEKKSSGTTETATGRMILPTAHHCFATQRTKCNNVLAEQ